MDRGERLNVLEVELNNEIKREICSISQRIPLTRLTK